MTNEDDLGSSSCSTSTYRSESEYYTSYSSATSHDGTPLALFQHLENEIGDNIHLNIDLAKFAHEVWDVDEDTIEKLLSMSAHRWPIAEGASEEIEEGSKETFSDAFWDRLEQGSSRHRFPDLINSVNTLPDDGTAPSLSTAKNIIELKRTNDEADIAEDKEDAKVEKPIAKSAVKPGYSDDREPTSAEPSSAIESKVSSSSLKRRFDSVEELDDASGSSSKKQRRGRGQPLRNTLMPLFATETLGASSRHYVVGVIIDQFDVTVCYFDRFVVTCVESFSFDEEPSKLALVLYAMHRCDRLRAGFDPHLLAREDANSESIIGSCFGYEADATDSEAGAEVSTPLRLRVTEVIRRPEELIGRATAVYKVQKRLADGTFSKEEYVHKLSWPPKASISEIDVVARLKERLPKEAHDHIPHFLFTSTSTPQDLNLPWLRLGLDISDKNHRDGVLRVMTGKLYHKLWEAGSIENFKQVWLDCVECLYLAYKQGKVLHQDLSEDNLMVSRSPSGEVGGVLNDWDMSKFLDGGDDEEPSESRPATGTPPFMAIDLLRRKPTRHYLRHDLESLFYILIWAALHYNLKTGKRDRHIHPRVVNWTEDAQTNIMGKAGIFTLDSPLMDRIYPAVKPEFADLAQEWIEPLRVLFTMSQAKHYISTQAGEPSDEETYGGLLTFTTFMKRSALLPVRGVFPVILNLDKLSLL
ncbi:hypothetical protein NMY22_g3278 [Coprinellus aureogranulatus]|nr:hypothetical protein NMY22_g3278 [Coprinellus aureogranulatus]